MKFDDFVTALTQENLDEITRNFNKLKNNKKIYTFSKIELKNLKQLFNIDRNFNHKVFNPWFVNNINLKNEECLFLENLLEQEIDFIRIYNEEDLKIHFIAPILNKINFKSLEQKIRDFYEETLAYETEDFILKGVTDFVVAKGLEYPEKPYFFIQEFKKGQQYSNPEPQLLAELISAIELNDFKQMKGCFIVGENWNFVIVNKLDKNKYQYSISRTFNATNIGDLKDIYKNLLFIKKKIMEKNN